MRSGSVIIDKEGLKTRLFNYYSEKQTELLVEYAAKTIEEIGGRIISYHSKFRMERTGNLLDSLCWGVSFKGELKASGFFREQKATNLSYLHELSDRDKWFPVGGHTLAANFIRQMGNLYYKGWRVFFAVLAPYWGYWEEGHNNVLTGKFERFAVMTEFYDKVTRDLKPATTNIRVDIPETTDVRVMKKRTEMRSYRMDRNLGSPYDKYKGKYKFDKSLLSRGKR